MVFLNLNMYKITMEPICISTRSFHNIWRCRCRLIAYLINLLVCISSCDCSPIVELPLSSGSMPPGGNPPSPYYHLSNNRVPTFQNGSVITWTVAPSKYSPVPTSGKLHHPYSHHHHQHLANPSGLTFKLNKYCQVDVSLDRITCQNLKKRGDLPKKEKFFDDIQQAVFVNISGGGDLRLEDFRNLFPNLIVLTLTQSPFTAASLMSLQGSGAAAQFSNNQKSTVIPKSLLANPLFARRLNFHYYNKMYNNRGRVSPFLSGAGGGGKGTQIKRDANEPELGGKLDSVENVTEEAPGHNSPEGNELNNKKEKAKKNVAGSGPSNEPSARPAALRIRRLIWPSVQYLNLSWNEITSEQLSDMLPNIFPNLERIDLSHNFLTVLDKIESSWENLEAIDISGNPLDCVNLDWTDNITLLHEKDTLCEQPPHQNMPKPIRQVVPLVRKVRKECRVPNCTCDVAYVWEQNDIIYSKTVVNCSSRKWQDFPDPSLLPQPTDTLDLRNNHIKSMSSFIDNELYLDLNVMTLYLDDNQISSIDNLERSEWFDNFQVFSIRRNHLYEVPVHVLENAFHTNKNLLQIDLSSNRYKCDCSTVSNFKVWLLKYSKQIGHIDDVRCYNTKEQIRYMRLEEWCQMDSGTDILDLLDLISIILAMLIIVIISKVYYDYTNFKQTGKLPWIVSKM